jgi:hypothetical protein
VVAPRRSTLRAAATSLRTATTAASLTLVAGMGAMSVLAQPPQAPAELGLSARPMDRMLERNNCSLTGFPPDVIPASAVVREADGRARLVSFDLGWAVFNRERPGELVAVCLGPDRSRRLG